LILRGLLNFVPSGPPEAHLSRDRQGAVSFHQNPHNG
jgi:hypothetical protein